MGKQGLGNGGQSECCSAAQEHACACLKPHCLLLQQYAVEVCLDWRTLAVTVRWSANNVGICRKRAWVT